MGKLILFLLILIVILGGGYYFIASRSNDAVPGDTFYVFDRVHENIWQTFTARGDKIEFELDLLEERASELSSLTERPTEFTVLLEAMNEIISQENKAADRIRDALAIEEDNTRFLEQQTRLEDLQFVSLDLMKELAKRYDVSSTSHLKTADEVAMQQEMNDAVAQYKEQIARNSF